MGYSSNCEQQKKNTGMLTLCVGNKLGKIMQMQVCGKIKSSEDKVGNCGM